LRSDSFFESGRATINDKTREQLEKLGETLAGRGQKLSITGYTDSIPIENLQFPSNWELSAARAATVARTFIYMGVDPALITIEGKADNDPVAPNSTPYGRSLNRRVIILVNKQAEKQDTPTNKPAFDLRNRQ
jgi:chemotaxis protein MotB